MYSRRKKQNPRYPPKHLMQEPSPNEADEDLDAGSAHSAESVYAAPAAPTMAMAMQEAKHTLELKEQQISHLQEKVALLMEEKVFLHGRLEEVMKGRNAAASSVSLGPPVHKHGNSAVSYTLSSTLSDTSSEEDAKRYKKYKKSKK